MIQVKISIIILFLNKWGSKYAFFNVLRFCVVSWVSNAAIFTRNGFTRVLPFHFTPFIRSEVHVDSNRNESARDVEILFIIQHLDVPQMVYLKVYIRTVWRRKTASLYREYVILVILKEKPFFYRRLDMDMFKYNVYSTFMIYNFMCPKNLKSKFFQKVTRRPKSTFLVFCAPNHTG